MNGQYLLFQLLAVVLSVNAQDLNFAQDLVYEDTTLGNMKLCVEGDPKKSHCLTDLRKLVQDKFHREWDLQQLSDPICLYYRSSLAKGVPLFNPSTPKTTHPTVSSQEMIEDPPFTSCVIKGTFMNPHSEKRDHFHAEFLNNGENLKIVAAIKF